MSVQALNHLFESVGDIKLEVFVIDNASKDDSASLIKKNFPQVHLIENLVNVGFGRANNQVLSLLHGEYVLLLNTDAFVQATTLQKTVSYMQANANCGILGVRLEGRDGDLQPSCRFWPTPLNSFAQRTGLNRWFNQIKMVDDTNWDAQLTQNCDWVPGCYYLIRKKVIDQVGLFDPIYFLYYEEVDHCMAVKEAGWDVAYFADTTVVHIGGESAKSDGNITSNGKQLSILQAESELIFFRKNHGVLTCLQNIALIVVADTLDCLKALIKLTLLPKNRLYASSKLMISCAIKTQLGSKAAR